MTVNLWALITLNTQGQEKAKESQTNCHQKATNRYWLAQWQRSRSVSRSNFVSVYYLVGHDLISHILLFNLANSDYAINCTRRN